MSDLPAAMRVVHVITLGDVGGAQTHVVELATAQRASGLDVAVVAGSDGPAMDRLRTAGIPVEIVPALATARRRVWHQRAVIDLRRTLSALAPDLVHCHSSNAGLIARIVARRLGVPSVYTAHGWPFQRGAAWHQRIRSWLGEAVGGRLGDVVICLTEVEARRARRARVAPADRIRIVPNGIGDVPERAHPGGDRPLAMVMVARFAPPKLQVPLLAALGPIADAPWTLTLVGDGPEVAAAEVAAARFADGRVRLLGHRDDVSALLADHDVSILWSRYEGMPMATLEAMRAGLACIAGDLPGVHVLFGDPPAGVIARDDEELRAAVTGLIADRQRLRDLGGLARRRYEAAFSADAMAEVTRRVYDEVVTRAARSAGSTDRTAG